MILTEESLILKKDAEKILNIKTHTLNNLIKNGSIRVHENSKKVYRESVILFKEELEERRTKSVSWIKTHHAD
jgi:hypothetical protein